MPVKFEKESPLGQKLKKWWQSLEEHRGDRAVLRRAKNVQEIALLPEFHRALQKVRPFFAHEKHWEDQMAFVFGLLSHVRDHKERKLAEQMAQPNDSPVVSELRFRRLIQREREDLYPAMIRILRILKGGADLHDLARSVYYWGPNIKKQWAYAYFSKIKDKQPQ